MFYVKPGPLEGSTCLMFKPGPLEASRFVMLSLGPSRGQNVSC